MVYIQDTVYHHIYHIRKIWDENTRRNRETRTLFTIIKGVKSKMIALTYYLQVFILLVLVFPALSSSEKLKCDPNAIDCFEDVDVDKIPDIFHKMKMKIKSLQLEYDSEQKKSEKQRKDIQAKDEKIESLEGKLLADKEFSDNYRKAIGAAEEKIESLDGQLSYCKTGVEQLKNQCNVEVCTAKAVSNSKWLTYQISRTFDHYVDIFSDFIRYVLPAVRDFEVETKMNLNVVIKTTFYGWFILQLLLYIRRADISAWISSIWRVISVPISFPIFVLGQVWSVYAYFLFVACDVAYIVPLCLIWDPLIWLFKFIVNFVFVFFIPILWLCHWLFSWSEPTWPFKFSLTVVAVETRGFRAMRRIVVLTAVLFFDFLHVIEIELAVLWLFSVYTVLQWYYYYEI